ncbi:MAG: DUF354 domain-containing protein [Planctomyces sp.]|nr:DUF354 domain-containing protein [Planctomyces sp.]
MASQPHILVDLTHPAHVNCFKHVVRELDRRGFRVTVTTLNRGRLPAIIRREIPETPCVVIGTQGVTRAGIYLRTGVLRTLKLGWHILRNNVSLALGAVAYQGGLWCRMLGRPSLGIYDDPGHRINYSMSCRLLSRFLVPTCLGDAEGNRVPFQGLKEWAYLSPARFVPDESAVTRLGLRPYEYEFVREVDARTLNYMGQTVSSIEALYNLGLRDSRVVLSLENKSRKSLFPNWSILDEPVEDIHSLMHFSRTVISNGDSMAREGAMLGRPAVYAGIREMPANRFLLDQELLAHQVDPTACLEWIRQSSRTPAAQAELRSRLLAEWDDVVGLLTRHVDELLGREPVPQRTSAISVQTSSQSPVPSDAVA